MADLGIDLLLPAWLEANASTLHLFCNNYTPVRGMTPASFTEAAGGGYAAITLAAANWTEETGDTPRQVQQPSQTFTFTGALTTNTTIYGYYITNSAGTVVLWAQLLDTPFVPANNGDKLTIPVFLACSTGTPD
jgi:hypothetical protein